MTVKKITMKMTISPIEKAKRRETVIHSFTSLEMGMKDQTQVIVYSVLNKSGMVISQGPEEGVQLK